MAGAGSSDFFLQFGSDAAPFSQQLAADLNPGIEKINALRAALVEYDDTVGRVKGGKTALGITFDGLDQAASRLETASKEFSGKIETQLKSLTDQVAGLAEVLRSVQTVTPVRTRQPAPVGGPEGNIVPVTGMRNRNRGGGFNSGFSPEQQAILAGQRRASTTTVTPADEAAAQRGKRANEQAATAASEAALANGETAKSVKATATALKSLDKQLQALISTAKGLSAPGKSDGIGRDNNANVEGALEITNTTANPVPVIVVGGQAQAAGGHPVGHHGHTPTATTATSTAAAREEVQAAATLVNVPNSRKNPTRVAATDTVAPGQYYLLPGDDEKRPRRAAGIRPGESVGTYLHRVEGVNGRVSQALSGVGGLSTEEQAALDAFRKSGGKIPEPKVVSTPLDRVRTMSADQQSHIDEVAGNVKAYSAQISDLDAQIARQYEQLDKARKSKKASRPYLNEYNALVEQREDIRGKREEARSSLRDLRGGDLPGELHGIRTGAYVATPEKARVTGSELIGLPKDIQEIVKKRNAGFQAEADAAHNAMLQELLRDPRMTQDGLPRSAKSALKHIDDIMLNPEQGFGRGDVGQDQRVLRSLFGDKNNFTEKDAGYFLEGATRRRYLADTGAKAADDAKLRRSLNKQLDELQHGRGLRDDVLNETSAFSHEQGFQSDIFLGQVKDTARQQEESGVRRRQSIANAGAQNRIAAQIVESLSGANPEDFNDLKTSQGFERQVLNASATERAELGEKIRRAQKSVKRNQARGRSDLVATNADKARELQAQLDALTPKDRTQGELLRAATAYESLTSSRLVERVDEARPAAAEEEIAAPSEVAKAETSAATLNEQLTKKRDRLAKTAEGSKKNVRLKSQIADLERQLGSSSNVEQEPARSTAGGRRIRQGQSINLATGRVEDANGRPVEESTGPSLNLPGAGGRRRHRGAVEEEHDFDSYESSDARMRQAWWDEDAAALNSSRPSRRQAAASGGGAKPPKPPKPPVPAPAPEPAPEPRRRQAGSQLRQNVPIPDLLVDPATRQQIISARAVLARGNVSNEARLAAVARASSAFYNDPNYRANGKPDQRVRALAQALGLDVKDAPTRNLVQQGLQNAARTARTGGSGVGVGGANSTNELAGATERAARMESILATASGRVREAMLAELIAEENVARVRAKDAASTSELARAEMQLSAAQRNSLAAQQQATAEQNKSRYATLTGRRTGTTFGGDLLRHGSYALENTIGYSLVFTGFEKLREVVQTGIEAQAVFVRLQASLEANGIAAGDLQTKLTQISATTATPLEQVTEAAAELSGTLKTASDISFGTNIASQLANISQGALTAKEAAVGLRDVIAAFGDEWASSGLSVQQGMQQAGDQIAHLSQLTGVSVKDITEGTTQIAAEAHEFGLSQRQAATLAAYISKGTGESGEESAAQASRMLATLYNGKTQNILETTRVGTNSDGSAKMLATPEEFASGNIGGILADIAKSWGKLTPRQRQSISAQMGTGIQARAFAAFVGGGGAAAGEMNGTASDSGALNKQNTAYLQTVAGMIKQLDEDFQNLGNTLQRLGAFDAIGILAKSLDELFKNVNKFLGGFASLMNSNPLTQGLMHWSTIILEAAAAWKIFGGVASSALAKTAMMRGIVPSNQSKIDAATENGQPVPRPIYPFSTVVGAAGRRVRGIATGSGRGLVGRARATGTYVSDIAAGNYADLSPAGMRARGAVAAAQSGEAAAIEARTKAEADAAAAAERVAAAGAAEQDASARLTVAQERGAVAENDLTKLRAAQAEAADALLVATREAAAAQDALAKASVDAAAAAEAAAAALARQAEVRGAGFMSGFSGSRFGMAASFAALLAAGPVGNAISGGEPLGTGGVRAVSGSIASGLMYGAGIGGMVGGPVGAAVGAVGGTIYGAGKAILAAKKAEDALPSGESDQAYLDLMNEVYNIPSSRRAVAGAQKRLGYKEPTGVGIAQLDKLGTVEDVNKWEDSELAFIKKHASDIEKAGGNNKAAQNAIKSQLAQLTANLKKDAERRIATLDGLQEVDQLNATQLSAMLSMAGSASSLNIQTLSSNPAAIKTLLQSSGLPTTGLAYQNLSKVLGVGVQINTLGLNGQGQVGSYSADGAWHPASKEQLAGIGPTEGSKLPRLTNPANAGTDRLKALQAIYREGITNAQAKLDHPSGLSSQDAALYSQALNTSLSGYQQVTQQIQQAPIQMAQGRASILASLGGTTNVAASMGLGRGGDKEAVGLLINANSNLTAYTSTLSDTDPQYWQNLQQIQQNKLQIAQLQAQPDLNRLMIAAAAATDATTQANLKYQLAVKQLAIDTAGGASTAQIGQDQAGIAAAGVGQRQAAESVAAATAQAGMAGIRNGVSKAQAQLNEALRQEAVYRQGGSLADQANFEQAIGQEKQARLAIKDAIEEQVQSAYDVTSAIQKLHGDALGAAQTALAKAQQSLAYAVQQYGKDSQQAEQALAQVYQAQQDAIQAQLDQVNSALDLDIANLNARGKQGDAQKAAQDSVKKAQNALNSYLSHGGKKGTKEYNDLLGQVATAQRNAFDVGLQAQLDTLDFQRETYHITSAQEVQSLQQILQNKQLTLKEQRDITMKIKNLQDQIRQQLTEGGLNIPSDIKLPTVYDVRRSLGAGFTGAGTSVNTVNNNQQVQINNNVPTEAVANIIVNKVVKLLNQQTSAQSRATTSTPRVVPTR